MSLWRTGWAGLLMALGAWQLSQGWVGSSAVTVLVAAAAVPVLLIGLGARALAPPVVTVVTVVLGAAGFQFACVHYGFDSLVILRDGVARLLAAPRPAPPDPAILLPGAAFTLLTGAWVGLRTAAGGLMAAPAGAAALYAVAALLGAGRPDPHGYVAAAVIVVAALGWATLRDNPARGTAGDWRLVPAIVAATGVVLLVGPIAMVDPFDSRSLVEPEGRQLREPSPLPRIAAWHQLGDLELMRYTAGREVRLRLVALNYYSGSTWSADARYRRIGTGADPRLRTDDVAVKIGALDGPWLPSPFRPLAVSLSDVEVDAESGSLTRHDGVLQPGLSYRVTAARDAPTETQAANAQVPSGEGIRPYLELPSAPAALLGYAKSIIETANTPYEKAVALEYAVREGSRHDPGAPAGSSYARLETFLFGEEPGAKQGTAEQFASAFAVLGRAVGLPTRIVVGFMPGTPESDGTRVVRGRDAHAWPEVYFSGLGWYPFDPTPTATARSELKQRVINRLFEQAVVRSPTPSPAISPVLAQARPQGQAARPVPASVPDYPVIAGSIVLALLGFLLVARRVRSLRHRRAGAIGAWAELLDLIVLIGQRPSRWQPAPVIAADLAGTADADHPAMVVAAEADRAAFGPDPAHRHQMAWRAMQAVRRLVRARIPWYRRLLWHFDPRPWRRR